MNSLQSKSVQGREQTDKWELLTAANSEKMGSVLQRSKDYGSEPLPILESNLVIDLFKSEMYIPFNSVVMLLKCRQRRT